MTITTVNHAHHVTMTYSGHGKYTATWKGYSDNTMRRTVHETNNWHDVDSAALQASTLFIEWLNDNDFDYEQVVTSVTVSHMATDREAIAIYTLTLPKLDAA
tara:strand:- start:1529 stop:1834 length:306 start_codon:yes stop_codon:yes gene_type:complete